MKLELIVGDQVVPLQVKDEIVSGAVSVFDQMDADMDPGVQAGRFWVEKPDTMERCQFVADRLLTALEAEQPQMQQMMAAYLLARLPGVSQVVVATDGEIQDTSFSFG